MQVQRRPCVWLHRLDKRQKLHQVRTVVSVEILAAALNVLGVVHKRFDNEVFEPLLACVSRRHLLPCSRCQFFHFHPSKRSPPSILSDPFFRWVPVMKHLFNDLTVCHLLALSQEVLPGRVQGSNDLALLRGGASKQLNHMGKAGFGVCEVAIEIWSMPSCFHEGEIPVSPILLLRSIPLLVL